MSDSKVIVRYKVLVLFVGFVIVSTFTYVMLFGGRPTAPRNHVDAWDYGNMKQIFGDPLPPSLKIEDVSSLGPPAFSPDLNEMTRPCSLYKLSIDMGEIQKRIESGLFSAITVDKNDRAQRAAFQQFVPSWALDDGASWIKDVQVYVGERGCRLYIKQSMEKREVYLLTLP